MWYSLFFGDVLLLLMMLAVLQRAYLILLWALWLKCITSNIKFPKHSMQFIRFLLEIDLKYALALVYVDVFVKWKNPWKKSVNLVITFQRASHLAHFFVSWSNNLNNYLHFSIIYRERNFCEMQFLNNKIVIRFEKFSFFMLFIL